MNLATYYLDMYLTTHKPEYLQFYNEEMKAHNPGWVDMSEEDLTTEEFGF